MGSLATSTTFVEPYCVEQSDLGVLFALDSSTLSANCSTLLAQVITKGKHPYAPGWDWLASLGAKLLSTPLFERRSSNRTGS
jgi:hypothetical protein